MTRNISRPATQPWHLPVPANAAIKLLAVGFVPASPGRPIKQAVIARIAALLIAAAMAAFATVWPSAASAAVSKDPLATSLPSRLIVDDNAAECPRAGGGSIQQALDSAAQGETILVCAGTYEQPIFVNKRVKLYGAQHGKDARKRSVPASAESLILTGPVFVVQADGVTIDGFSLRVVLPDDGEGVGLRLDNGYAGHLVVNNIMDADGTSAIWLGNSGTKRTTIQYNRFLGRIGIAAPSTEGKYAHSVDMLDNRFDGASLSISGDTHSDLVIMRNEFVKGGGISVADNVAGNDGTDPPIHDVRIYENKIRGAIGPAISLRHLDIAFVQYNTLLDGLAEGILAAGENSGLIVADNSIGGFAGAGVRLGVPPSGNLPQEVTTGLLIQDNEIEGNGEGVATLASAGMTLEDNSIEDNDGIGISIDGASASAFIHRNEVRGSGDYDCMDASSGSGTAGTTNTWTANEGSTSSPVGLCSDSP